MGKNLKGRECGTGIYQRKDGLYSARYNAKDGSRPEKYFETLPEARNWLADAIYEDKHGRIPKAEDMTVDQWYRFCMHALRHTYATRAIESGMQPKILQKLLGHASIKTTMGRDVHVTDDSLTGAVQALERSMAA